MVETRAVGDMTARRGASGWILALACWLLTSSAAVAAPAQIAAIPPGMARVWMLRQYQPFESLAMPMTYLNKQPLALSQPGTAFYRDLPPGPYTFTVDSYGWDYDQAQGVWLAPGMEVFLEVQSLAIRESYRTYQRDTFYVRMIPPALAWQHMQRLDDLGAR